MSTESSMLETIAIATQAQLEIKKQLEDTIEKLQSKAQAPKSQGANKFFVHSIMKVKEEKRALNDQINKYKNEERGQLLRKLENITNKNNSLESRIKKLQSARESNILGVLENNTSNIVEIEQFIDELKSELGDLLLIEEETKEKIVISKNELKRIREEELSQKTAASKLTWETELKDEKHFNIQLTVAMRRRSNTVSSRAPNPTKPSVFDVSLL